VLDNIAPLRQLTPDLASTDVKLFTPPAGIRSGDDLAISWWFADEPDYAKLEIVHASGEVLRTFEADTTTPDSTRAADPVTRFRGGPELLLDQGVGSIAWDLRTDGFWAFPGMVLWGARTAGPALPPGTYTARLTADGEAVTTPVRIVRNPWLTDITDADLEAQYAFSRSVWDKVNEANLAVVAIRSVKDQLEDRLEESTDAQLRTAAETLETNASAVEADIYQVKNRSNQDPLNFPIKVNNRLANLMSMAERGDGPPGTYMPEILQILSDELKVHTDRLQQVWATDLAAVNRELARLGLAQIQPACVPAGRCPVM
jgi:hypothetical protein